VTAWVDLLEETMSDGSHDFDFLWGSWAGRNRRLTAPLSGSDSWEEFDGELLCRPIFGGTGNVEEVTFPTKGFSGLTIRLFDPSDEQWSIYWVSSRSSTIAPPVVGRFSDGVGEFLCDDTFNGVAIKCRYLWTRPSTENARMEQAFSVDGGATWETNWVNDIHRD
jgi:hypothetical protein